MIKIKLLQFLALIAIVGNIQTKFVIEVPNEHRDGQPRLRFSLHGFSSVQTLIQNGPHNLTLKLEGETDVHFYRKESCYPNLSEYEFFWPGGGPNLGREICFHYGFNGASWYNTFEEASQKWPMGVKSGINAFNSLQDNDVANYIKEHLFLNSDGFALFLERESPLFLRFDPSNGDPLMCISVNNTAPYLDTITDSPYKDIRFKLFVSTDIKTVYDTFANKLGYIAKPTKIPDENMFTHPNWLELVGEWEHFSTLEKYNQESFMEFVKKLNLHGYTKGVLQFDYYWQDFASNRYMHFDENRFPNTKKLIIDLKAHGFRTMIQFHLDNWMDYLQNSEHYIKDKSGTIQQFPDVTNLKTINWFQNKLKNLQQNFSLDTFHYHYNTYNNLLMYEFSDATTARYPILYLENFFRMIGEINNMVVQRGASRTQDLPNFVRGNDRYGKWTNSYGFQTLIPSVLAKSIAGYSFIMPDIIGGRIPTDSEELYIRWVQATALLPSMQFMVPPWVYSERAVQITRKFVDLHAEYAPLIIELAKKRVTDGTPIIRPMWYEAPNDSNTFTIDDQFMLGDEIIVAPVVKQGQTRRDVYLPEGNWYDQNGRTYHGPVRVSVPAPIDVLPYFKKHVGCSVRYRKTLTEL